ncbi:hypothetical protein, partial [Acinetobacter baumannii]|uniref:hypothetical protein n=1 Tax=Acinetobacter baumannii TaxID=470 RepID=UPI001C071576
VGQLELFEIVVKRKDAVKGTTSLGALCRWSAELLPSTTKSAVTSASLPLHRKIPQFTII